MNKGKYIFAQMVEYIPRYRFDAFVQKYHGDKKIRSFSCRDQFLTMLFGQFACIKSMRSIVTCLNAHSQKLYHMGFDVKNLALSTAAKTNEQRDWRMYRDLAQSLIAEAQKLYIDDNEFCIDLKGSAYVLDSTIIELCLSVFPWAQFEKTTAAVKIHTQLNLRGNIPSFFLITEATTHDVNFLDIIDIEAGAFYIMDRAYLDFGRLFNIHRHAAFFIVRAKESLSYTRLYSRRVDKSIGLRCDQTMRLNHFYSQKKYPEKLRRIKYYDTETDTYYVYLTNHFDIDATAIANLYKQRWQIELFFKWIKQHLRIQTFWGHSPNAVKTHICIALCAFLIVAIMKKRLKIQRNLHEILQILNVSQFDKTPLISLLSAENPKITQNKPKNQLALAVF